MHPLIDAATLASHLDDPTWIVFDCRHDLAAPAAGEALYREAHLPGARFAHLDGDLSGTKTSGGGRHPLPAPEDFADFLAAAGADDDSVLVAYDASNGLYAARFWWLARWIGHESVAILDGGLAAWRSASLPMTSDLPVVRPARVTVRPSRFTTVDTDEVEACLSTGARLVIDARAPERFRGEVEPLDPVAGHMPGAVNRPMAASLAADGRFRDANELRAGFDALLAGRAPEAAIQSCGSGVTACHNLLAMEIAGLPGAALYPGSWSAWCSDPRRPVAKGDQGRAS